MVRPVIHHGAIAGENLCAQQANAHDKDGVLNSSKRKQLTPGAGSRPRTVMRNVPDDASYIASMLTEAEHIMRTLALSPHPEGGYYAETFRSAIGVSSERHDGPRSASTAIYFLLCAGDFSALHRVSSDEVWHHYAGDPLELLLLHDDGRSERVWLGSDLGRGERPQHVVPSGVYQAARPEAQGQRGFSLCGCTVAPGFEFRDFEMPSRTDLTARFPMYAEWIAALTR